MQREEWIKTKPLQGLNIVDTTPVFRNTLYKYLSLIYAGANLYVSNVLENNDSRCLDLLREAGIPIVTPDDFSVEYDIIMDCSAEYINHRPRLGFVELTRGRVELYADINKPVFLADGGMVKRIETFLGTGESYFRALRHLGYFDFKGKNLLVFGSGKVGEGIIHYGVINNMMVTVVTDLEKSLPVLNKDISKVIDCRSREDVDRAVREADYIVTATGVDGSVESTVSVDKLVNSKAILANMGITDEYGDAISASRVLEEKRPINFILEEPTQMKYIDATMALHNYGAEYLLKGGLPNGIIFPPCDLEDKLLKESAKYGVELPTY